MRDLRGKVLFITGASRGIGKAVALRAARDGAKIVIASKTAQPHPRLPGTIFEAAAEIDAAGGEALAVETDIRLEDQVYAAIDQAVARFGGIDILVNNASAISLTQTRDKHAAEAFRSDDGRQCPWNFCLFPGVRALAVEVIQSAYFDARTPSGFGAQVVRAPSCLHRFEVRHEPFGAGNGRGVPRRWHRGECALAAYLDRYRGAHGN